MLNSKTVAPNLQEIINSIEKNIDYLASAWIKIDSVKNVFKDRKISSEKFKDKYAVDIIMYFINVVKGTEKLGNCPVMSKLVYYLLKKKITPKEVFDICMGLRKAFVFLLFKNNKVLKNPYPYMYEVSLISDANLSGVLDIFTNYYQDTQNKLQKIQLQTQKLKHTSEIINFIKTKIIIVQNSRIILANKPLLDMLGVDNLKELYHKYEHGFDFMRDVDLLENDFKVNLSRWIRRVCAKNKPFKCEIYNEELKISLKFSGTITNMPEENIDQYIITLNNISDYIKDEADILDSLTHDELTGFKNYPSFEKLISKQIDKAKIKKSRLFLAVADIPELREINDKHGRNCGDMVIAEVAENLRFLIDHYIHVGRLEGSRFGILIDYKNEQASYDWCVKLFKLMNEKKEKKTLAITEVDLSESINKVFLRVYDLIESSNNASDNLVVSDFNNVIEYKELPEQKGFTDILSHIKSLEVSVFYLELAVLATIDILSTTTNSITMNFSAKQLKVSDIDTAVYFNLKDIGNIKAYISDINHKKQTVVIDRFRFDKHSPLDRTLYRIKVQDDIKAYIVDGDREYTVKVLDMNNECVAVEIDRKRNFDINSFVYLDMYLPISNDIQSCGFNASILRIDKIVGGYKMILLANIDTKNKSILNKFISKNQMDIIKEFKIS